MNTTFKLMITAIVLFTTSMMSSAWASDFEESLGSPNTALEAATILEEHIYLNAQRIETTIKGIKESQKLSAKQRRDALNEVQFDLLKLIEEIKGQQENLELLARDTFGVVKLLSAYDLISMEMQDVLSDVDKMINKANEEISIDCYQKSSAHKKIENKINEIEKAIKKLEEKSI